MTSLFGALRLPSSVIFGCGQRKALGPIAASIGRRALVCTDQRMAQDPECRCMIEGLKSSGVSTQVYDSTAADVPIAGVYECTKAYRSFQPDVIIGLGGGTCMDMAKSVSLLLSHGGDIRDYYGENKLPGPILPVIAIPTTSGTGSEVTPVAVVADEELKTKVGISSPFMIPRVALCDPELTVSCPPALTAASGADALTHAVEAFTASERAIVPDLTVRNVFVGKNALSDVFALLAIQNIWTSLKRAYENGTDLEARQQMMFAALAAGCAFGTAGTAGAHAIQYPVGNETHTPHGVGVGLLLPYVMEFNRPTRVAAFAQIARSIGLDGRDDEQLSHEVIDVIADLLQSIGIPRTLMELGLPADKQDWTAEIAMNSARLINNNPRTLDVEALRNITRAAFSGQRTSLSK